MLVASAKKLPTATPLARGEGVDFTQVPPILTADYNGRVTIKDLGIVWDFRTVNFGVVIIDGPEAYKRKPGDGPESK